LILAEINAAETESSDPRKLTAPDELPQRKITEKALSAIRM